MLCRRLQGVDLPKLASQASMEEQEERQLPESALMRAIFNFTPSWFSIIMGTGILSILLHSSQHRFPGEAIIGTVLYFINILMFFVFTVISLARCVLFPWAFLRLLHHPAQSLFLGCVPMGLATIVNATVIIAVPKYGAWAGNLCWALWWVDVILTVLCVLVLPVVMFQVHVISLNTMTAAWLLPIVPAVVCAACGGWVASAVSEQRALITLTVSYVLWGLGMSMSLLVMALYFHRLAIHQLPNSEVIVSAFLPLGPCGQGAFGLIQLAKVARNIFDKLSFAGVASSGEIVIVISLLGGLMIWGLGLWWLIHGTSCLAIRMLQSRLRLKFNMGFWGLIFPLGVFVSATTSLGQEMKSQFFAYLSNALLGCLVILYIFVSFYTISKAAFGDLLVAPCMADLK